ncbi:MAG: osomolarity two-component system sensor histidine kinase NIK1 [Candidatus Latescibacterota bacterium]
MEFEVAEEVAVETDGSAELAASPRRILLADDGVRTLDGFEVVERVRAKESAAEGAKHQIIIALTAHASTEDRQRCLQLGMDNYLTKPLRKNELVAALRHVV